MKDITPKADQSKVIKVDLKELGFTLQTSDETMRKIEKMRRDAWLAARKARDYIFGGRHD